MKKVKNLYAVKANVLPARVMVLLSKYAQIIKEHEGVVIQLSSLNVFKHVHASYIRSNHQDVHRCYKVLLSEVNRHLAEGNMNVAIKETSRPATVEAIELDDRYRSSSFWRKGRGEYSVSIAGTH